MSALTLIVNPEVSLGITANEKAETAINLGDHIVYEVTAENISDVLLKDVEVVVEFGTLGSKIMALSACSILIRSTMNMMEKWSAIGSGGQRANSGAREMRPRVKEVFTFELTVKPNLEVKIEADQSLHSPQPRGLIK